MGATLLGWLCVIGLIDQPLIDIFDEYWIDLYDICE